MRRDTTGKVIMRLLTLASGPAVALLLAAIITGYERGRSEIIEGSLDAEEPILPSNAPGTAPRPTSRTDALLAAMLDTPSGAALEPYDLRQLAGPPGADPLAADLTQWEFLSGGGGDWREISAFLKRKPTWPNAEKLRARAEQIMPEDLPVEERLAFFGAEAPVTARGARLYGEALMADGRGLEGATQIVRGWREMPAPPAEERLYLAKHGALVAPHHPARFEMLIWRRQISAADRLSKNLPEEFARLTDALAGLFRRRGGVDRLIARVPEAFRNHPALGYARMVWREAKRRRSSAEEAMRAATEAGALGRADAWADERVLFVREAWEDGRFEDALALAEGHGLTSGRHFAEIEWLAGWIAFTELDDPHRAIRHFATLYRGTTTPISRSRGAYWAGRSAQGTGDAALAELWFRRAAAYPVAFYGQLAIEELGEETLFLEHDDARLFKAAAGFGRPSWTAEEREMARVAARLYRAGEFARGRAFVDALAEQTGDPTAYARLALMARRFGDSAGEIVVAKIALNGGVQLWTALYPIPRAPDFRGGSVEPALMLAIARQESRFKTDAVSRAGARGLMQLMPATAREVSGKLGLPYDRDALFSDPSYNLKLADAFMSDMLAYFDGSYVLAIAAYNGGPGNVQKWIKRFGDPRDPDVDVITWIERIPFAETRNYVMRVLEAMQVYRIRLAGGRGVIRMSDDLARGRR